MYALNELLLVVRVSKTQIVPTPLNNILAPGLSRCTACAPAPGTQNLPVVDDPSGDGSSYLFRVDTAATPERLLLPAPALEALVFRPVVDRILREAKEMLDDPRSLPADKVCHLHRSMHFRLECYVVMRLCTRFRTPCRTLHCTRRTVPAGANCTYRTSVVLHLDFAPTKEPTIAASYM